MFTMGENGVTSDLAAGAFGALSRNGALHNLSDIYRKQ
jgi:hypothetical protein